MIADVLDRFAPSGETRAVGHEIVHRTRTTTDHQSLHFRLGVVCTSLRTSLAAIRRQYQELYAFNETSEPDPGSICVEVRRMPLSLTHRRRYEITVQGQMQFQPSRLDAVLPHIEWAISWHLPRSLPQYSQLHASVLECNGGGVIFPGAAGVGKSTLAVGLVTRGWRYLCDEFALLHTDSLELHPYPRAICIKEPGFPAVEELGIRVRDGALFSKGSKGLVALLSPLTIRPDAVGDACPLRFVIFPKFIPGTKPAITPISRAEAAFSLHEVCFNLLKCQRPALDVLAEAIRGARCYRLQTGDLRGTCDLVQSTVEPS